jgi:hypothetical protein
MSILKSATWVVLGAALTLGVQQIPPFRTTAAEPAERDPYLVVNGAFRAAYAKTRKDLQKAADPVFIDEAGTLVLLHGGKRLEKKYQPAPYDEIKTICHIPLALYVMLLNQTDLSEEQLAELARYREKVEAAKKSLDKRHFVGETLTRQETIVADSLAFLDAVAKQKKIEPRELLRFARTQGKHADPLMAEVARMQIDALDAAVKELRENLNDDDWKRLKVVVMGSAMTRPQHLAVQYFARLLGEPGEGRRIIYAEGLWNEDKALELLGKHLLDGRIGADFFNDDRRMMRDLLGDEAKVYLEKKLPR